MEKKKKVQIRELKTPSKRGQTRSKTMNENLSDIKFLLNEILKELKKRN